MTEADLVACTACGAVFTQADAPSRQCPVCHYDGTEESDVNGVLKQTAWSERL